MPGWFRRSKPAEAEADILPEDIGLLPEGPESSTKIIYSKTGSVQIIRKKRSTNVYNVKNRIVMEVRENPES